MKTNELIMEPKELPFTEPAQGKVYDPDGSGNYNESDYNIICDGGCKGNPGRMYGSYQIATKNGRSRIERLDDLGAGTNNVAEYKALLEAIQDILERCQKANVPTERFTLSVRSDSQLMVNQLNGVWNVSNERLQLLFEAIHDELTSFKNWDISWVSRDVTSAVLGH